MAWQDFVPVDEESYMTPEIMHQAYDFQLYLINKSVAIVGKIIIAPVNMSKNIAEYGRTRIINLIEGNLKILISIIYPYNPPYLDVKLWLGAGRDIKKLSFLDVNRWFYNMTELDIILDRLKEDFLYSGEFYSSDDKDDQHFDDLWS